MSTSSSLGLVALDRQDGDDGMFPHRMNLGSLRWTTPHPTATTSYTQGKPLWQNSQTLSASTDNLPKLDEMASSNPTEHTPLLDGDVPEANRDNSIGSRTKHFLRRNFVYIILVSLLVLVLILFPILYVRKERSDSPSEATDLCTSAACVLASANILRSLSPR